MIIRWWLSAIYFYFFRVKFDGVLIWEVHAITFGFYFVVSISLGVRVGDYRESVNNNYCEYEIIVMIV